MALNHLRIIVPRRVNRSTWYIAAVAGVILIGIWLVVWESINHARTAALQRAISNGSNLSAAFSDDVAHTLDAVSSEMDLIAARMREPNSDMDIYRWARDLPLLSAGALRGAIIGPDGKIVSATSDAHVPHIDVSDREHFYIHRDGKYKGLYIGVPVVGRLSHTTSIEVSKRVDDAQGRFLGIVVYSIPPRYLTDLPRDVDLGPKGTIGLVGLDDIVRVHFSAAHPDGLDGIGQSVAGYPRPAQIPVNGHGYYIRKSVLDGVTRLFSYRRMAKYPLVVNVAFDMQYVAADAQIHGTIIVSIAAAATLLLCGLGVFLFRERNTRARHEIELAAERDKLKRAQALASIGSFERDIATNTVYWSGEMYRILGLDPERTSPSTHQELPRLVHPDDLARFTAHRAQEMSGVRTSPLEYRIIRPDGTERTLRREAQIFFDENRRPVRIHGTLQDITEAKQAEQQQRELERKLVHSQKLEALGTLAGGIAHDLNNTLTPILALSKITARQMEPKSLLRSNVETIFAAGEQARDLVKRILAFSRQEEIDLKPVDLRNTSSEALKLMRASIPASIGFDVRLSAVPPVLADESQIYQVLTNLISNAAQAIGEGLGTITIALEVVGEANPVVRLSVIDNGKGMDADTQRRIFEPFFTTKAVGQGTGLGLSIIDGIVTSLGGWIEVTSAPGKGARFDVYFVPISEKSSAAA